MDLFCFASRNEDNIRRGIVARKWAVAKLSESAMRGRITKARKYLNCAIVPRTEMRGFCRCPGMWRHRLNFLYLIRCGMTESVPSRRILSVS